MPFSLAIRDDFHGALDPRWSVYKRVPGGKYDEANVTVDAEMAHLVTDFDGEWRSGGMALQPGQVYGSFRVRCRLDPGSAFRGVLLLWPDGGSWPPEIDFHEIGGSDPDRVQSTQTLHYGPSNLMKHTSYRLDAGHDFTELHNLRVDWTPGSLVYRCDGVEMARYDGPEVPAIPMHLCIQTGVTKDPLPPPDAPGGGLHCAWAEVWSFTP